VPSSNLSCGKAGSLVESRPDDLPTLTYLERPQFRRTILIVAWAGWPDAAEAASRTVREVNRRLPTEKFASIDPEHFYDFSQQRPTVSFGDDGVRMLNWPTNEFYYWQPENSPILEQRDVIVFLGVEPHLQWRRYADQLLEVADPANVDLLITVGALLDSVPHTRSPRVTVSAGQDDLGRGYEGLRFPRPTYEGPSGITSVITERYSRRGVPWVSLWGHAPHYVQVAHNPSLAHAILRELQQFLPREMEMDELRVESEEYAANLTRALEGEKEIAGYVQRLEERYDTEEEASRHPEPGQILQELEDYLRRQRGSSDPGGRATD
jgi:proteasome assembly chaperone (PAC2) family protein